MDIHRGAGPVNLKGLARLSGNPHGRFADLGPLTVKIPKLCTHVGVPACCISLCAILGPEEAESNSFFGKFPMDTGEINGHTVRVLSFAPWIKDGLQLLICHIGIKGPFDLERGGEINYLFDRVAGTVHA